MATILFCPMEWGLGHAVRLVPMINHSIRNGDRVILAADGVPERFYRNRYPDIMLVRLPFYQVTYSHKGHFFRKLLTQVPGMLRAIRKNRRQLKWMVESMQIDLIITDHRYGMHHPGVQSVFITNQLWLRAPRGLHFGEPLVYALHLFALRRFSEIWIADFREWPGLSGRLTHPWWLPRKSHYIEPVSRFEGAPIDEEAKSGRYQVLALLSGPEPQRTLLEEELMRVLGDNGIKALILRGKPRDKAGDFGEMQEVGSLTLLDHAPDEALADYITTIPVIVCRPGNSTLSDLIALGRGALLVPTPGQTEQEYVAGSLFERGYFGICRQGTLTPDVIMNFDDQSFRRFKKPDGAVWKKLLSGHFD